MNIDPNQKTYVDEGRALSRQIDAINEDLPAADKLTQVDIARHMGITPQAVNNYLSGRRPMNLSFARIVVSLFSIPLSSYSPRLHDELADLAGVLLPDKNLDLRPAAPVPSGRQITNKALIAWENLNESLIRLPMTPFPNVQRALDTVEKNRVALSNQMQSIVQGN